MKKIKSALCIALCAAMVMTFSACSITDLFDRLVSGSSKAAQQEEEVVKRSTDEIRNWDESIQAPVFTGNLTGTPGDPVGQHLIVPAGSPVVLDGTAETAMDSAVVTYQWYSNTTNSNSGGTLIPGATDPIYQPDTSEVSDSFYFVVATSSVDKNYISSTSEVKEVDVRKTGTFTQDEFGGVRYLSEDGTYPTLQWMVIDGNTYHFTETGYVSTGWLEFEGRLYYFDEASAMLQRNAATPDGYQTDENGAMIVPETPVEEQPVEETVPEGEGAAAEQPAETAGGEGQE